jgi:glutathione S-transferase
MVPVIDDGGVVVWESNVIARYLATSRGRTDLLPTDPAARARVEQWMDWQASDFNNSWRVAFQGLVRKNPDHQDPSSIERSLIRFSRMVAIVDAQLAKSGDYICGARFSLADIPIGLSIHRWRSIPADRPRLANVGRYYERLCERPGFRQYGRDGGP